MINDSVYFLFPFLIKLYNKSNDKQKKFNQIFSSYRIVMEYFFDRLKNRFVKIRKIAVKSISIAINLIDYAIILYNYLMIYKKSKIIIMLILMIMIIVMN